MKSSQSNFNLWSPDAYLVRSYIIATVILQQLQFSYYAPIKTSKIKILNQNLSHNEDLRFLTPKTKNEKLNCLT